MAQELIAELHDIGKLISHSISIPSTDGKPITWHGPGSFSNIDWAALGHSEPDNATWLGAKHHLDDGFDDLATSTLAEEVKADVILLMIADNLAATSSRAIEEEIKRIGRFSGADNFYRVFTLWRDNFDVPTDRGDANALPLKTRDEFLELVGLVEKNDAQGFLRRYGGMMDSIPEDKAPISAVTSLSSHYRLVNQFYAILKKHSQVVQEDGTIRALSYGGISATQRGEAKQLWEFKILKCKLSFPQTPVRVRDLNVLSALEAHSKDLLNSEYGIYVLFHTTDTIYLFLPLGDEPAVSEIMKDYLDDGFYVEIEETRLPLANLTLAPKDWKQRCEANLAQASQDEQRTDNNWRIAQREYERMINASEGERKRLRDKIPQQGARVKALDAERTAQKKRAEHWQKNLSAITANGLVVQESSLYDEPIAQHAELATTAICELCQMRPATRAWTTIDESLEESLCEVCYAIRERGELHGAIGRWEREASSVQVAWVKLTLDYDWAQFHLAYLFDNFVDAIAKTRPAISKQDATDIKASLRPVALLADLTADYQRLTQRFSSLLQRGEHGNSGFARSNIVELTREYKDFYIIRLDRPSDVLEIINIFRRVVGELFPMVLEECPVRISISAANIKHPFFEHWRFCQRAPKAVNIQLVGRAQLHLDIAQYDILETLPAQRREVSSFLHRVSKIEAESHSRILPQVEFMQDENKLPENIAGALKAGRLDWRDVLNYYKLARR